MNEITEILKLSLLLYGAPVLGLAVMAGAFGLPVPSSLLVIAAGIFSRQGSLDWYYAAALGLAGAVVGDCLGFAFGRWGGQWISRRYGETNLWINAQSTFNRGSGVAVFLTRFLVTAVAVPVNFLAGNSKLRFRSFLLYAIAGEAMWIILYGGAGYFFSSQWESINYALSNFGGIALVMAVAAFGVYWWRQKKNDLWEIKPQFAWIPIKRLK